MHVLGFGTYDTSRHPRVGILLAGLEDLGVSISQMNRPLRISTSQRVAILKQPWRIPAFASRLLGVWTALCWSRLLGWGSRTLRRVPNSAPDAVLVGYLGHFDVLLARLLFPKALVALDMLIFAEDTASDRGEQSRLKLGLLRRLDRLAMSLSTLIILDTEESRSLVPDRYQSRVVVCPVGAEKQWFKPPEATPARFAPPAAAARLKVIFFGLFTPLQGTTVIGEAIATLQDAPFDFTMVGTGQDYPETRRAAARAANVTWLDWIDPTELPTLVQAHDVCLGIFGESQKARRVVPNKVFEGAAAGCVIITADTPAQRRALGHCAIYTTPGDARGLRHALLELAATPVEIAQHRERAARLATSCFRPRHSAAPLLRALQDLTDIR